jgi:putative membrane protein
MRGGHAGWWIFVGFLWLAFWVAVVVVVVGLLRGRSRPALGGSALTPALHLLEERYARGEISREEFLERRAVLQGVSPNVPPPPPAAHADPPAEPPPGTEPTDEL